MLALSPRLTTSLVTVSAAAIMLTGTVLTAPADAATTTLTATTTTALSSGPIHYDDGAVAVPIQPQAQEQSNWCWAATGGTIAAYKGRSISQNTFCNLAFGRSTNTWCPNSQATLANDQRALSALGIRPGSYINGRLSYAGIGTEISNDRPILTRIQWSSGGGHMMVISGYRASDRTIEWYDPWPSSQRLNVGSYSYYLDNWNFSWTHSLYGIGA
ncbi:papain-like cysteine protease family protein [Janibacter anophelis]|uniref:papain-like cysteine protease family protein n=1 Tax=Janibacter anophelis TaxID=319054 RepID=UPI000ABD68A2|nr:papain-like cysteine protease family protein [Janibacter anophelis]